MTNAAAELRALARVRQMAKGGQAKAVREHAGIGLAEMAERVGCSPRSLARWEAGAVIPRQRQALQWLTLLEALGELEGVSNGRPAA
jgi:DNA-binding transcriptional regulator YiaG